MLSGFLPNSWDHPDCQLWVTTRRALSMGRRTAHNRGLSRIGNVADAGNVMVGPVSAAAESGMQVVPGRCTDGPVAWIGGLETASGAGPGVWFGAFASFAVAAWPAGRGHGADVGVGVEDAVVTHPDHKVGGGAGQEIRALSRMDRQRPAVTRHHHTNAPRRSQSHKPRSQEAKNEKAKAQSQV